MNDSQNTEEPDRYPAGAFEGVRQSLRLKDGEIGVCWTGLTACRKDCVWPMFSN